MGSSGNPNTTTQTVIQQANLPQWYQDYLNQVMGRALTQANSDQPPPPTQQVAPLTALQNQGIGVIQSANGSATPYYNQANDAFNQAQGIAGSPVDFQGAIGPGMQGVNFTGQAFAGGQDFRAGESFLGQAGATNTANAASPYTQQGLSYLTGAANGSALSGANPYIQQATAPTGLNAASPYLQAASQSAPQGLASYMSPYTSAVTDRLATLAGRNLSENILPQLGDQFVRSGQFGSAQQRDLMGRAVRDTQESLLAQQAQALEQGYGTALSAEQTDLARQAQLAGTAGGLGTAQQQTLLGAGSTTGQLSATDLARLQASGVDVSQLGFNTAGAQATDAARMLAAGQGLGALGGSIGQLGLAAAQAQGNYNLGQGQLGLSAAQAQGTYNLGQSGALTNTGIAKQNLGTTGQNQTLQYGNALYGAGATQQGVNQQNLNSMYSQQQQQYNLPWTTIGNLSSVIQGLPVQSNVSGQTTTQTPSPSIASQIGGIGLGVAGLGSSGLFKARGGAVRKQVKYKSAHSYGNVPKRGLGVFEEAA